VARVPDAAPRAPREAALRATEVWFERHGLPYFVPEQRAAVRQALRLGRTLPLLVAAVLVAAAAGVALAWLGDQLAFAPAALVTLVLLASVWYALTALRARAIVVWAFAITFRSLAALVPVATRALPLLVLFVTFLFVNTEVWQVSANLGLGDLWLVVLLFLGLSVAFLLVRLPEEVDRADDGMDAADLAAACAGTPLEGHLADVGDVAAEHAEVSGPERWNLLLMLLLAQLIQVTLLAVTVAGFLLVLGAIVIGPAVYDAWLGAPAHPVLGLRRVTSELLEVAVFLGAFSGFYLTVSAFTDDKFREQFAGVVGHQLERAIGVRAAYRALRQSSP
jgi:hypothetical protein